MPSEREEPVKHKNDLLRLLPAVEKMLNSPELKDLYSVAERSVVARCAGEVLENVRIALLSDGPETPCFAERDGQMTLDEQALFHAVIQKVTETVSPSMKRVVNATGVIIHTNLGRSVLPKPAIDAVIMAASHYSTLEYDLKTGHRSKRAEHVRESLARLCGAEDAIVVNNNAAAVLIALNTLASGKEVIVSRGELVEIGGSFRMPDVMAASGAILREVGATNKTKLSDYEHAITGNTALILKVHTSNYRIVGFSHEASVEELSSLCSEYKLPLMVDLGSGLLLGPDALPMPDGLKMDEPVALDMVRAGAEIVTFSADKLLGASQAGVIVGKAELVQKTATNPLARAMRIDKLSLAALDATLKIYLAKPTAAHEQVPTLAMLTKSVNDLSIEAEEIRSRLRSVLDPEFDVNVEPGYSKSGGGSSPLLELPTVLVSVSCKNRSADSVAKALRNAEVPVIVRIAEDSLLIDPRTLLNGDVDALIDAFRLVTQ